MGGGETLTASVGGWCEVRLWLPGGELVSGETVELLAPTLADVCVYVGGVTCPRRGGGARICV